MPRVTWEVVSTTDPDRRERLRQPLLAVVTKQLRRSRRQLGLSARHRQHPARRSARRRTPRTGAGRDDVRRRRAPSRMCRAQPNPCVPPGAPARGAARACRWAGARGGAPVARRLPDRRRPAGRARRADRQAGLGLRDASTPRASQADCGAGLTVGIIGLRQQGPAAQARRLGRALGLGLGHEQGARLLSRPTRPSTRRKSRCRAIRATARRRSWRWPTTSGS